MVNEADYFKAFEVSLELRFMAVEAKRMFPRDREAAMSAYYSLVAGSEHGACLDSRAADCMVGAL